MRYKDPVSVAGNRERERTQRQRQTQRVLIHYSHNTY